MSLLDKFSPGILQGKEEEENENKIDLLNIKYIQRTGFANVINDLCEMGYNIDSLSYLLENYKFTTVEEAINLLSMNENTLKYNHKFYPLKNQSYCGICNDNIKKHETQNLKTETSSNECLDSLNSNDRIDIDSKLILKSISSYDNNKNMIKEYGKINIPIETKLSFDNPNICTICYENLYNKNNISHTCQHFFCDKCMNTYLTNKIINGDVLNIKCLLGGCQRIYSDKDIKLNVNSRIYKKYKNFKYQKLMLLNIEKHYVQCPYPDCSEFVEITNFKDEFVECENKHYFCYKCRSLDYHRKFKCQNDDKILLSELYNNYDKNNYKQCPRCQILIEKNSGCNEIKCINCGYIFCWICLEKCTSDHYNIYNFSGCPGLKNKENKNNKCLNCLLLFFSFFLAFFLFIFVIVFFFCFGCSYEFVKCYYNKKKSNRKCFIIILLILLGLILQPLFLIFYIMYGIAIIIKNYSCCLWCFILSKKK